MSENMIIQQIKLVTDVISMFLTNTNRSKCNTSFWYDVYWKIILWFWWFEIIPKVKAKKHQLVCDAN